jgi:hypothetical protein
MKQFSIIIIGLLINSFFFASCEKDPTPSVPENTDQSANYTVSTFAGNGTNGLDPSTGAPALFNFPADIAFDASGNLFVADYLNDKIRKITPSGIMTTYAGTTTGYSDGPISTAEFYHPSSIAFDQEGNLFVAEAGNLRIRKISTTGIVSTLAGSGVAGYADGTGISAQIDDPGGMAIDSMGNIYLTQKGFYGIRKITPEGVVSTFVGSTTMGYAEGKGTTARFSEIYNLEIDGQDNIYVPDFNNSRIRKVTADGIVSTSTKIENSVSMHGFTMGANGTMYATQGNIETTEIITISQSGKVSKIAGGPVGYIDGPGNKAQFTYVTGFKVASNGNIYLAELSNLIRIIKKN